MHSRYIQWLLCSFVIPFLHAAQPQVTQTLSLFHRPESVAFSLDGRTLFVSNCGSDVFGPGKSFVGFVKGNGSISKLDIDADGNATVADLKFIEHLSANVGIAVLPKSTSKFPEGTLLINHGISLLVDPAGKPITDPVELHTGISFHDPLTGNLLGDIPVGAGSKVAQILGHITLLPNSMAFDRNGNLFVTDTAMGGDRLDPKTGGHPGLVRIAHDAIDNLMNDDSSAVNELFNKVTFTPIPGFPNGVGYWADRNSICVVTMGGQSPEGTAIYILPEDSFPRTTLPSPFRGDVGTADGIVFTPAGTLLTSRFAGDILVVPSDSAPYPLSVAGRFAAPADHRLTVLDDGSCLLAIPDQDRNDPRPWQQMVKLIKLPKGF